MGRMMDNFTKMLHELCEGIEDIHGKPDWTIYHKKNKPPKMNKAFKIMYLTIRKWLSNDEAIYFITEKYEKPKRIGVAGS
jgi:hypothetical protein